MAAGSEVQKPIGPPWENGGPKLRLNQATVVGHPASWSELA